MSGPIISIIVVYWNSAEHFPRCMDCIALQTFQNFEVIIIDNGSTDGGLHEVEQKYSQLRIRVEHTHSNIGFAAGNNLGARLAQGKWLALLNTDAFPEPDWLSALLAATETNPAFAAFSSRQLQAGHPEILDGAGDAYHVSGLAWRIGLGYPAKGYQTREAEIFSPCAAAALYLREAFLAAGGFDDDFFSYFEDVDLGFRLQLHGYRSLYVPQAVVHHVGSSTFGVRSDFAFYHTHRNLIWTFFKNMPSSLFWRYLPAHLAVNLIYLVNYTVRGRGSVLWRAKWDAIKGLSKTMAKRQRANKLSKDETTHLQSLMEHGFFKPFSLNRRLRQAWDKAETDPDKT